MSGSLAFARSARLLKPAQFANALKGRRIASGALLMLHAGAVSDGQPRLGLVIGKRHAPHAVTRNAIKRVVRESFRHHRAALPAADYAIRLYRPVGEISLTALKRHARAEADAHFARALKGMRQSRTGAPS